MAARRSRFQKTIDFKQWAAIPAWTDTITADETDLVSFLSFAAPFTILRCRGDLILSFDETKQIGDTARVGFGLAVLSTDAVTLGPTAVPDPLGEPEFPWLYWEEVNFRATVAAGEDSLGLTNYRMHIDTKAMRKVKPGQSLVPILQFDLVSGIPVMDVDVGQIRVLVGN